MVWNRPDLTVSNYARAELKRAEQLTRYIVDGSTGCWIWTGGIGQDGYGKLKRHGKTVRAHRVFYEHFVGVIPQGLVIMHSCDNPLCVNPKHLSPGTHLENELDKDLKGRRSPSPSISHPHLMPRGEASGTSVLTEVQVKNILSETDTAKVVAEKYGVSKSTILSIRSGKTWTHITEIGKR